MFAVSCLSPETLEACTCTVLFSHTEEVQESISPLFGSHFARPSNPQLFAAAPDPFLTAALPSANRPKSTGDLRAVIAASNDSHPQGSLFDDEIDLEEADAVEEDAGNQARGNIIASDFIGSSPPKRVVSKTSRAAQS